MHAVPSPRPVLPDPAFWRGRRVLLTGHTGFKGAWTASWLAALGATVGGFALDPHTVPALWDVGGRPAGFDDRRGDVRDAGAVRRVIEETRPEIVLHLAAQALVRESHRRPLDTFATNVMGTVHLLEALREVDGVRAAVIVTTDKVYAEPARPHAHGEDDPLGGHDPYAAGKAACELAVASWRRSFLDGRVAVATARAGNVIGGGDWSADRLIPDAVRAWGAGRPLLVRRPTAIRPWQHVLEPVAAYLVLAERLVADPSLADAYNIGPDGGAVTVRRVVEAARAAFGRGEIDYATGPEGPHESERLELSNARARERLGIVPRWSPEEAIERTMRWYRDFEDGRSAAELCRRDLDAYGAGA